MSAVVVVVVFPVADDHSGVGQRPDLLMLRHSSRMRELNDST